MTSQCNADCHCGYGMEPLCGAGNINYFSPCYAGCKGSSLDGKVMLNWWYCNVPTCIFISKLLKYMYMFMLSSALYGVHCVSITT